MLIEFLEFSPTPPPERVSGLIRHIDRDLETIKRDAHARKRIFIDELEQLLRVTVVEPDAYVHSSGDFFEKARVHKAAFEGYYPIAAQYARTTFTAAELRENAASQLQVTKSNFYRDYGITVLAEGWRVAFLVMQSIVPQYSEMPRTVD